MIRGSPAMTSRNNITLLSSFLVLRIMYCCLYKIPFYRPVSKTGLVIPDGFKHQGPTLKCIVNLTQIFFPAITLFAIQLTIQHFRPFL